MNAHKRIPFKEQVQYQGRNGWAKMKELNLYYSESNKTVSMYPINSRNTVGSCELEIPLSAITEFIVAINEFNPEPLLLDTTEIHFLKKVHEMVCNQCGLKGFFEPFEGREKAQCEFCQNIQKII